MPAQRNAPTKARSVRFGDPQWESLDRIGRRLGTDRAGVLRRLVAMAEHDERTAPTHTLAGSRSVNQEACLWCRLIDAEDPVQPRTATLRQNQEPTS
jgi:hypothetical protein